MLRAMLRATSSAAAMSGAASLLLAEPQGLAIDLTDSYFFASKGRYGSAEVKDLGTPANNFDSVPGDLLTYTGTTKMTRQSDGVYRYGPHNLYVNSASPANQSVTVVSGATYAITLTGSVSITLSGATTGTVTAGTTTFTAGTTTLTCGSTSGSGTVHVRRTPSDSTYLATGASAKYGLPYEWNTSGVLQGILVETQATNLFLDNTTGATQTITVSNATAYTVSFFGTGSITFSGANSSTLNGTGATDRVSTTFTTSSTSLTCTVSGSITDVQVETGSVATSVIRTYAASATRAADNISLATSLFSASAVNMTAFVQYNRRAGAAGGAGNVVFELSAANRADAVTQAYIGAGASNTVTVVDRGAAFAVQAAASFAATDSVDHRIALAGKTNDFAYTADGAAPVLDTAGTYQASPFTILRLGFGSGTDQLNGYLKKFMCIPRRATNSELQTMST